MPYLRQSDGTFGLTFEDVRHENLNMTICEGATRIPGYDHYYETAKPAPTRYQTVHEDHPFDGFQRWYLKRKNDKQIEQDLKAEKTQCKLTVYRRLDEQIKQGFELFDMRVATTPESCAEIERTALMVSLTPDGPVSFVHLEGECVRKLNHDQAIDLYSAYILLRERRARKLFDAYKQIEACSSFEELEELSKTLTPQQVAVS